MNDSRLDITAATNLITFGALLLVAAGWAVCATANEPPLIGYLNSYKREPAMIHGPLMLLGLALWGVAAGRLASRRWRIVMGVAASLLVLALLAALGVGLFSGRRIYARSFLILVPAALFALVAIGCFTGRVSGGFFKYATYFTGGALMLLTPALFVADRLARSRELDSALLFALPSIPLLLAYLSRWRWPQLGWGVPALFVGVAAYHGYGAVGIVARTSNLSARTVLTVAAAVAVALISIALAALQVRALSRRSQRHSIEIQFD